VAKPGNLQMKQRSFSCWGASDRKVLSCLGPKVIMQFYDMQYFQLIMWKVFYHFYHFWAHLQGGGGGGGGSCEKFC
jgi:hypothetical protein